MTERYSEYADDNVGENKYEEIDRIGKAVTRADIQDKMHMIWQQYPRIGYVGTYNHCGNRECGYTARGAGLCARCAANELCDAIGPEDGNRYHKAIQTIREIETKYLREDG